MKRLTFFYPVRNIGGAQLAFARIVREMAKRPGWLMVVVDFEDGFLRQTLNGWGVDFEYLPYSKNGPPVDVGETLLLLSYSGLPHDLQALRATPTSRVLLWSLFPQAILAYFKFGFFYKRLPRSLRSGFSRLCEPFTWAKIRRFSAALETSGSLAYMDGPNAAFPLSVGFSRNSNCYLPVPIDGHAELTRQWSGGLSLAWLGRLAHDKAHTVCAMLDLCSHYAIAHGLDLDFHIIGDGPALARLKAFPAPGVRKIFPGILHGSALDEYVATHVKIGYAMGTSLLEFAMRGVPTLIGDYSNGPLPASRLPLRWLVPNEDYSLGEIIGERARPAAVGMAEVIALCRDQAANEAFGRRCREYAENNHRIDQVCTKLVGQLAAAKYCFESTRPIAGDSRPAWGPRLQQFVAYWNNLRQPRGVAIKHL